MRKATKTSSRLKTIAGAFDQKALKRVCEMREDDFAEAYDLDTFDVDQAAPYDFFHFRDNSSSVLAVAHLDTVSSPKKRRCQFLDTAGGTVVYSRALDDRLGAYVILELLPKLGLTYDVLLTTGEESGRSTAEFFDAPKQYDWIIEFDRAGTDVVMYQFEDSLTRDLVKAAGARVGIGAFSDICFMDHLGIKGFNWGVGYQDAHGDRAHAYLDDTFDMVNRYLTFHEQNEGQLLEHEESHDWWWSRGSSYRWDDADWDGADWDDDVVTVDKPTKLTNPLSTEIMERYDAWSDDDDVVPVYECDLCGQYFVSDELRTFLMRGTPGEKIVICPSCIGVCREEEIIGEAAVGWPSTRADLEGKKRFELMGSAHPS